MGFLGPQTRSALNDFQRSEGMQASGDINRETISALGLDAEASEFSAFIESEEGADTGVQNGGMQDRSVPDEGMQDGATGDGSMSTPGM